MNENSVMGVPEHQTMKFDYIFCTPDRPMLAETHLSLAFLDSFPISKGHALIVPARHVVSILDMTDEEYVDAFDPVRQVKDDLQVKCAPHEFNIGVNCGEAADQSVWHAPIHVIPNRRSRKRIARAGAAGRLDDQRQRNSRGGFEGIECQAEAARDGVC